MFPTQQQTTEYVQYLITQYDKLVEIHYSFNPNFANISRYLPLYESPKLSFEVLLFRTSENSTTVTIVMKHLDSITNSDVVVDTTDNFQKIYGGNVIDFSNSPMHVYYHNVTFQIGSVANFFPIAIIVPDSDLVATPYVQTFANSQAETMYEIDSFLLPKGILNQTEIASANSTPFMFYPGFVIAVDFSGIGMAVWIELLTREQIKRKPNKRIRNFVEYVLPELILTPLGYSVFNIPRGFGWVSIQALFVYVPIILSFVIILSRKQKDSQSKTTEKNKGTNKPKKPKKRESDENKNEESDYPPPPEYIEDDPYSHWD